MDSVETRVVLTACLKRCSFAVFARPRHHTDPGINIRPPGLLEIRAGCTALVICKKKKEALLASNTFAVVNYAVHKDKCFIVCSSHHGCLVGISYTRTSKSKRQFFRCEAASLPRIGVL